jgi:hypothetical protein
VTSDKKEPDYYIPDLARTDRCLFFQFSLLYVLSPDILLFFMLLFYLMPLTIGGVLFKSTDYTDYTDYSEWEVKIAKSAGFYSPQLAAVSIY